jgi:hypothetical protein
MDIDGVAFAGAQSDGSPEVSLPSSPLQFTSSLAETVRLHLPNQPLQHTAFTNLQTWLLLRHLKNQF